MTAKMISQAQKEAYKRYTRNTDEIRFRVKKDYKTVVSSHAQSRGETVGEFVSRAINETITRDDRATNTYRPSVLEICAGAGRQALIT